MRALVFWAFHIGLMVAIILAIGGLVWWFIDNMYHMAGLYYTLTFNLRR